MAKFSNAKLGDKVYDIIRGKWGVIIKITDDDWQLTVDFKDIEDKYDLDGKGYEWEKPRLYWNEVHLPTDEEDKKPFDLVEFLKENLKPKKFVLGEANYYLEYSQGTGWSRDFETEWHTIGCVYFSDDNIYTVVMELTEYETTSEEVMQAFKQLGWL